MTGFNTMVNLDSSDHDQIFRFLLGVAREGLCPGFTLDGRAERDLLKVARALPQGDIPARFHEAVGKVFAAPQTDFRMTGCNLAHRHNQVAAAKVKSEGALRRALALREEALAIEARAAKRAKKTVTA